MTGIADWLVVLAASEGIAAIVVIILMYIKLHRIESALKENGVIEKPPDIPDEEGDEGEDEKGSEDEQG